MSLTDHVGRFIVLDIDLEGSKAQETQSWLRLMNIHESERIHFPPGIEYVASCPIFRKRKLGEMLPRYTITYKDGILKAEEIK